MCGCVPGRAGSGRVWPAPPGGGTRPTSTISYSRGNTPTATLLLLHNTSAESKFVLLSAILQPDCLGREIMATEPKVHLVYGTPRRNMKGGTPRYGTGRTKMQVHHCYGTPRTKMQVRHCYGTPRTNMKVHHRSGTPRTNTKVLPRGR